MPLVIDDDAVNQAADLMRRVPKDTRKEMNRRVRDYVNPWLRSAIRRNARTEVERKLAGTARVRGGSNPAVVVGSSGKFSGGAKGRDIVGPYEFGTYNPYVKTTYTRRSPRGRTHTVKRATKAQLPRRNDGGYFIFPAVKEAGPMIVSAWVGYVYDTWEDIGG